MQNSRRAIWIYGFTLFSLFFGAGNLILPPQLGLNAGTSWWLVVIGFCLSAVLVPLLGIIAHAQLQGGLMNFGLPISKRFSFIFSFLIYAVALTLPAPRTAAVTHEMAILPYWELPAWISGTIYFSAVFVVSVNRSKISGFLGKWLSPLLLLILFFLIFNLIFQLPYEAGPPKLQFPFAESILEGYQTFDAIGAVVAGGVILISMRLDFPDQSPKSRFKLVLGAGWIAGLALTILYTGLIYGGTLMQGQGFENLTRTDFLLRMGELALGPKGVYVLSLLFALACFTTAVGIVTGTADFISGLFGDSELAYRIAAFLGALVGVLMGQFSVADIIQIALPVLQLVYPVTIVLIVLNAFPLGWISTLVFRLVVTVTLICSLPEFFQALGIDNQRIPGWEWVPFEQHGLGWIVPSFGSIILLQVGQKILSKRN